MGVVPRNNEAKLSYYVAHLAKWLESASQIGLTTEQVEAFAVKVQAAREMLKAQRMAQSKARSATLGFNLALDEVSVAGSTIIQQIRTAARVNGENVYSLATVSPPRRRSPIGSPGKPTSFNMAIDARGTLMLKWECKNPRRSTGTVYQLWRQIAPNGPFTFLGISGSKKFEDETVPAGTSTITYRIQAVRSRAQGPIAEFPVNLASSGRRIGGVVPKQKGQPIMIAA